MADNGMRTIPTLDELLSPEEAKFLERAIAPATGLALFSGHFASGKLTIAMAAALAQESRGHPVVFLAESPDSLRDGGIVPPSSWTIVGAGRTRKGWSEAFARIETPTSPVLVIETITPFNAAEAFDAASRLRLLVCVETPLIGTDVFYALSLLGLDPVATVERLTCLWSQILVPRLCQSCREPISLGRLAAREVEPGTRSTMDVWREVGCHACSAKGTRGLVAAYEALIVDDATRESMTAAATSFVPPALPPTHRITMQVMARDLLARGTVGIDTFRREITRNPLLRATNQIERERDASRKTREAFRRFVDEAVIENLVAEQDAGTALGGRRADATCLFCDVRGFTRFSEEHEPQQVFRILNRIVDEIIALVIHHGGMVDKLIGDSVMALFGLPVERTDHARSAVACALAIQARMGRLTTENPELARLKVGIGINSGELAVGFLGNAQRMDYTVLGDVVNTAARLESIAAPGQILLGPSTRHRLGRDFDVRDLGEMALKGKTDAVRVHELVAAAKQAP